MKKIEKMNQNVWQEIDAALRDRQPLELVLGKGALCWLHRP